MKTFGIVASGGLGLSVLKDCYSFIRPLFIATDSKSFGIIEFAETNNIPLFKGNPRNGSLSLFLENNYLSTNVLLSINYLFIIEKDTIERFQYAINFHGSLLPKYRGRTPHVWAIINNEKETGVTAHIIDENCDTGDVILQKTIPIEIHDTGATILEKYDSIYPNMIREIYDKLNSDTIILTKQNNEASTFFGKRTPEDGQIDWNWQKERIFNWVRAQAFPYPGSFTLLDGEKVIIDEVKFSEFGFNWEVPNGTILQETPEVLVKTPNGVLILNQIRENKSICKTNKIFNK